MDKDLESKFPLMVDLGREDSYPMAVKGSDKPNKKKRIIYPTLNVPEIVPEKEGYALVKYKRRNFSSGEGDPWDKNPDEERNESRLQIEEIHFMEAEPIDRLSAEIAAASKANPDSEDDEEEGEEDEAP